MLPIGFQFFADAGTLVNATGNYVNAGTGATTAFSGNDTLTPTMKTFYDTQLLENARPELVHAQFAGKQALPRNHGKTVEWRKWNTLKDADELTEGVIPTGQKMGQTSMTASIKQIGTYVSVSDQLELHALDNVILGATEELGASAGTSTSACAIPSWRARTCSTATRYRARVRIRRLRAVPTLTRRHF